MTYLDIVNNVLRRLRESTVSDITETTYSTMVGDFVLIGKTKYECKPAGWSEV